MIVVSDSTPLIHIAKVGLILEQKDAVVIKEYIGKKIHVQNASSSSSYLGMLGSRGRESPRL